MAHVSFPDYAYWIHMASQPELPDIALDASGLYREEIFSDRKAGTIRRMTPVTVDGSTDPARPVLFSGQTQLLTPAGVLPLVFEIDARTLDEAIRKFPAAVKLALNDAIEEAREMRREAASRIVVPDVGAAGGIGPGPGVPPGGGKIKFP
ncbi:MAG TPA: hypothetical protein VJ011_05155 [Steroidobacteraceae bacterium]|nr:hypothetical protein [Steroidobacteraceae bacterium]